MKRIICLLLCAVLAFAVAGCGSGEDEVGSTLVYAVGTLPEEQNPYTAVTGGEVLHNVYDTLLRYHPEEDYFEKVLCNEYYHSDDGLTWTFVLRSDAVFHDGEPVDAGAVKHSVESVMAAGGETATIWSSVNEVEAVDQRTVRFHLDARTPMDLVVSAAYGAFVASPEDAAAGSGPYRVESWENGEVNLALNEDYWDGFDAESPQVVQVLALPEEEAVELMQGSENAIAGVYSVEMASMLGRNRAVAVHVTPALENTVILMDTQSIPLDNYFLRLALIHAFPYEEVLLEIQGDNARPAQGVVPDLLWGHSENLPYYRYDETRAGDLLVQAGYSDGGSQLTALAEDEEGRRILELFAQSLSQWGITLHIVDGDSGAVNLRVVKGSSPVAHPAAWVERMFSSGQGEYGYYINGDFDLLLEESRQIAALDRERGAEMYQNAQQYIQEDAAAIPVMDGLVVWSYPAATVKGVAGNLAYPGVIYFADVRLNLD